MNIRIYEAARDLLGVEDAEFLCECGRADCGPARVTMLLTDFADSVSTEGSRIVASGHEESDEEVVRSRDGYLLVRKSVGAA